MRAKDVEREVGYKPDELTLRNVLTVGNLPADDLGAEVGVTVSWHGTMVNIEGEVDGKTVMLIFGDDQFKEICTLLRRVKEKYGDVQQDGYAPVPDGVYGEHDTITVAQNGTMLEIHSAYGDGSKRHHAMIPLPNGMRLWKPLDEEP